MRTVLLELVTITDKMLCDMLARKCKDDEFVLLPAH